MNVARPVVTPFDAATAPRAELEALHAFTSALRAELVPGDPPTPFEQAVAGWRANAQVARVHTWLARKEPGGAVVGRGQVICVDSAENRALAQGGVEVLPAHRRRGLAARLLAPMAGAMRAEGRTLLLGSTHATVPGGAAFMERLGAERGLEAHVQQLRIAGLDPAALRSRLERVDDAFELGFWEGPYAESDLEAIADLYAVMGTQPTGTLAIEPGRPTPQQLRRFEAALATRGMVRWTAWVRERATGRFAGFTEVFVQPHAPELLQQGNTGVLPRFRGRGLGSRLKAAMLERVRRERPDVRFVRTSTADSNEAMRAINRALGFEPYTARTVWQIELAGIERWLGARR